MSELDIERLGRDADYWDEVAPEGAIYFDIMSEYFFDDFGYWPSIGPYKSSHGTNRNTSRFIPRPTKQKWEGGLPLAGCECRLTLGASKFNHIRITYMGDGVFCYLNMESEVEYTGALYNATFYPIKSPRQRLREELIKIISDCDEMAYSFRPDDIADAILSRLPTLSDLVCQLEPKT